MSDVEQVQRLSREIDDRDTYTETHRFVSRILKTDCLLRHVQGNLRCDEMLFSSIADLHRSLGFLDVDNLDSSSGCLKDPVNYVPAIYTDIGLSESDFRIVGVETHFLVCEKSSTIPHLYDELCAWLSEYRGY